MPSGHHPPVLDQAGAHGSSGQSAVKTGFAPSAIPIKPSPGKLAAAPNPHSRPSLHRFSAGSFFGGFRTPALLPGIPLAPGRHPKPFPIPVVGGTEVEWTGPAVRDQSWEAELEGQIVRAACRDEPGSSVARSRPARRRARSAGPSLRLVHGGVRYGRSDAGKDATCTGCAVFWPSWNNTDGLTMAGAP